MNSQRAIAFAMEGHTDSVPIHTARFPSNWELSPARAIAMLRLLTDRFQVDHMRMSVTGYADTVPVAPNDTPEGPGPQSPRRYRHC